MVFQQEELLELYNEIKETDQNIGDFSSVEGIKLDSVYVLVSKKIRDADK